MLSEMHWYDILWEYSFNIIPLSYNSGIPNFSGPFHCWVLLSKCFLSCVSLLHTHCVSHMTPSLVTRIFLSFRLWCAALWPSICKEVTNISKILSVWPLAKECVRDFKNNTQSRKRKRLIVIVGTTGRKALTHLWHRVIGWTDVLFF